MDYLTQLLGSDKNESLKLFVLDVDRAKNGELKIDDKASQESLPRSINPAVVKEPEYLPNVAVSKNGAGKKVNVTNIKSTPKFGSATTAQKEQNVSKMSKAKVKQQQKQQQEQQQQQQQQSSAQEKVHEASTRQSVESSPQATTIAMELTKIRGKASFCCGCFGTLHKALSNCLHCGRISCEKEGLDFCPFCGYLVEEVKPIFGVDDEAWQLKERLLQYDRESAVRTTVSDDQAEFYNHASSVWLTQEERTQATRQEEERMAELHSRQNLQLNLQI